MAPVRSLLQRLGPHVEDVDPVVVGKGEQIDPEALVARLVGMGYRREYQVEHRGELAVRGSIVDVFGIHRRRAGPDRPVGRRGRPADRVLGRRPALDRRPGRGRAVRLPGAAAHRRGPRAGRPGLVGEAPWGREQWERLAEGLVFDGMESWLPWLTADEHLLVDLLPPNALVVLVEPRRMRDRAAELLDEEAALAGTLGPDLGRRRRGVPPAPPALRPAARPHRGGRRGP